MTLKRALVSVGLLLVILGPILFVLFPLTESQISRYVIPPERGALATVRKSPEGEGVGGGEEALYLKAGNNFTISFKFFGCSNMNVTFSFIGGQSKYHYNWTNVEGEWRNASFTLPTDWGPGWLYESDNVPYQRLWLAYISYVEHTSQLSPLNAAYSALSICGSLIIGISLKPSSLKKRP